MIVIDITKLRDYKCCVHGILVSVFRCSRRWVQSEFRCFEIVSALDGVLRQSSLLTGSRCNDLALSRVCGVPMCRWMVMLLGGVVTP